MTTPSAPWNSILGKKNRPIAGDWPIAGGSNKNEVLAKIACWQNSYSSLVLPTFFDEFAGILLLIIQHITNLLAIILCRIDCANTVPTSQHKMLASVWWKANYDNIAILIASGCSCQFSQASSELYNLRKSFFAKKKWSGQRESNPPPQLGKLIFYQWTMSAYPTALIIQ